MKPNELWVSEIFRSLQGEGPFTGHPATFIRTAFCNLHCTWCDAWYTWDTRRVNVREDAQRMTVQNILPRLTDHLVVVTGGEPMMWADQLIQLIQTAGHLQHLWQFETNGTIARPYTTFEIYPIKYVVSPKLTNNGYDPRRRRINLPTLRWYLGLQSWFKFVIEHPIDIVEMQTLLQEIGNVPSDRVYLMPKGNTVQELDLIAPWLADVCKKYGYKYSDRLHIRLWGDRRGT
jgi:7-carboxy-7-deazaguanine synthase